MRPRPEHERLNDQLHMHLARWSGNEQIDQPSDPLLFTEKDPEAERLVALACHLQAAPSLQVNPDFARRLEQRILLRHLALGRQSSGRIWQTTKPRGSWFFSRPFMASISMAVVLLCSLLGTGMFALAAHVTSPSNPLYTVKQWEQQVQLSLAHSPSDQAEVGLQIARDRLNTLASAHGEPSRQVLADLNGQINALERILETLPAGPDRQHLTNELATLKASGRQVLRDGLPHLSLSERLLTTDELGQLGEAVTQLDRAVIVFSASSPTQATISLTGSHLEPGGHLIIDQVLTGASGTLHNGMVVFVVNWNTQWSVHTIGVLNPDGTVAQTTVILFSNAKENPNNDKNTQIGSNKGNTTGNMHTNNISSNGFNTNKQDKISQNNHTTDNGSNSHGHKNNQIQPSP